MSGGIHSLSGGDSAQGVLLLLSSRGLLTNRPAAADDSCPNCWGVYITDCVGGF